MTDFLLRHGWRRVGDRKYSTGRVKYVLWDHPEHQPDDARGCFTTTTATAHQREVNKIGQCDCIKEIDHD